MTPELWRVRVTRPLGYRPPPNYSHSQESSIRNLICGFPRGTETITVPFFSFQTARNQATMASKAGLIARVIPCAVVELEPEPLP